MANQFKTRPTIEEMKASMSSGVNTTATTAVTNLLLTTDPPTKAMPSPNEQGMVGIKGCLVIEGEMTGDGRMVETDAVYWENGPWSLMSQLSNTGHDEAPLVGRIDNLARMGNRIMFEGVIDTNITEGKESVRMIVNQLLRGISLDPDDAEVEYRLPDGRNLADLSIDELDSLTPEDWDGVILVATQLRVRGGTMLPMPAFVDTELECYELTETAPALVASANFENLPPSNWFEDPQLKELTPLTLRKDGRLYGHIAPWGQCHIGISGSCITPPHSNGKYANFTRGSVRAWCEGCGIEEELAVGPITASTGHADGKLSKAETIMHYDNSGSVVANVAAGEDEFGIWVSGRIAPTASKEQIDSLLSMGVSGDWRRINGALELVAVLSVPVSGFPVKRATTLTHMAASGAQTALITPLFGSRPDKDVDLAREIGQIKKTQVALMADRMKAV